MNYYRFLTLFICIVLIMGFSIIAGATPDTITTQVYVYGGDLTESFSALAQQTLTLTGKDGLTTDFTPVTDWKVTDARGTGAGWQINISADSITNGNKTIDLSNLTVLVTKVTKNIDAVSSSDPSKIKVSSGEALTGSVSLIEAPAGEGMGSYDFCPVFTLKIPASTYAGEYSCNLTTTTLESGPAL